MTIRELLLKPIEWISNLTDSISDLFIKIGRFQILDITLNEIGSVILLGILFFLVCLIISFSEFYETTPESRKRRGKEFNKRVINFLLVELPIFSLLCICGFFLIFCLAGEIGLKSGDKNDLHVEEYQKLKDYLHEIKPNQK